MAAQRTYLAIDLKSFYASVECVDRHLDPLTTNLVVADASRTEKTICLAVSPSLKAYRIPGRARLFEAVQRVKEVNAQRLQTAIRQKKAVRGEEQSSHKTVFAKVPAMGQIWRDFGHAFSFASSSSRGIYPSPSYLIWMCCTRFPLDLSGAST